MVILTWMTGVILELVHAPKPDFLERTAAGAQGGQAAGFPRPVPHGLRRRPLHLQHAGPVRGGDLSRAHARGRGHGGEPGDYDIIVDPNMLYHTIVYRYVIIIYYSILYRSILYENARPCVGRPRP